ncbi:MAG TPA: 2-oxo-4-hydroxy-4-carboxy-5-ureidoimidazoline decarboxylase, partial [Solirubrobacteraceae bacterium]
RAATGCALARIPVRPEHLVGLDAEEAFVARYGAIFEGSAWVARAAFADGPFTGVDDLHAAMVAAVRAAPRERRLELIRAHPELAGRGAQAGELTGASASEQASAGLQRLTPDEAKRWRALNAAYRERFGFPLVVCVREHTEASILAWGQERLGHDPEAEVEIALAEIAKIARLRLEELER